MVSISPVGLSTSSVPNQLSALVTLKEKLCRPFCITSSVQPKVELEYIIGTPTFNNATVFVPVMARITVVTPGDSCNCKATTLLFTENFTVAFQGQTGLPKSVNIVSVGKTQTGSCIKCGIAYSYTINDSITVTLTPATAAV